MGEIAMECAICFEAITARTTLPCACNVDYCLRCWDRSLAASFNSGESARCPTCRTSVRVDFDAAEGCLVFSRESEDPPANTESAIQDELEQLRQQMIEIQGEGAETDEEQEAHLYQRFVALVSSAQQEDQHRYQRQYDTIERLAQQAIPAMTRKLQRYHAANDVPLEGFRQNPEKHLENVAVAELKTQVELVGRTPVQTPISKRHLIKQLVATIDNPGKLSSFLVSTTLEPPPCVCGGTLTRIDSRARTAHFLEGAGLTEHALQRALQNHDNMGTTNVICDVCDVQIPFLDFVWTCSNGASTILHATTYDVCDACFILHACGGDDS